MIAVHFPFIMYRFKKKKIKDNMSYLVCIFFLVVQTCKYIKVVDKYTNWGMYLCEIGVMLVLVDSIYCNFRYFVSVREIKMRQYYYCCWDAWNVTLWFSVTLDHATRKQVFPMVWNAFSPSPYLSTLHTSDDVTKEMCFQSSLCRKREEEK